MAIISRMMPTILLLGGAQAAFLVVLLLSQKRRHLPDYILAVWLSLLAAHLLIFYFYAVTGIGISWLLSLNSSFPFLQGPFLYFYVTTIIDEKKRFKRSFVFHLIPFVGMNIYTFYLTHSPGAFTGHPGAVISRDLFSLSTLLNWVLLLSVPVYVVWTLVLVNTYRQRTEQVLSDLEAIDLAWLRYIIVTLGGAWLVVTVTLSLRDPEAISGVGHLIFIPVTLFIYLVGFFGLKQSVIFSDYNLDMNVDQKSDVKYSKSGLGEEAGKAMHAKLVELMEAEKPYLDSELTLPDLAVKLDVSPNYLSQILNEIGGESYYDFINRYRVNEFTDYMTQKEFQRYTLLAVAMQSGFASKPSFNRAVKKITGKTPSQFLSTVAD